MPHSTGPQTSFNVISPRKPEERGPTGVRVGMTKEEKGLPNLDISSDGLGMLLYYSM